MLATEDPRVARSKAAVQEAAIAVISERGVADATVEEIAARSGVAKTTIYRHWPNRSALILNVVDGLARSPRDPDTGSLAGDLETLAVGLANGLGSGPWSALLTSLIDAAERDPELRKVHESFAAQRDAVIEAIVARARDRGEVRSDLTDREVVDLVAGPLFYMRMVRHRPPGRAAARRIAALIAELARPAEVAD